MQILLAVVLDCIFGDPKGLPHPVCLVGRIVKFWENIFYSEENAKQRGFIFCAAVLLSVAVSIEPYPCEPNAPACQTDKQYSMKPLCLSVTSNRHKHNTCANNDDADKHLKC